jgi:nucleotide-binding universal stress UspA family protein/sporulation protein YlmC with PRC-barrel domain
MDPGHSNGASHLWSNAETRAGGLRILVPLDDSVQAQRVLAYVRLLAAATHGTLNLIRATDVEDETSFNSLAQNAERLRDTGVSVEWSVVGGVDAETAIGAAEAAWQPDLIALASTKSSGLDRWLNGSDAEKVVKSARVPVLVLPPNWERPFTGQGAARTLVPLDGSPPAEHALWVVVHLANMLPMDIVLMRAIHRESAAQGAEVYLRQLAAKVQLAVPDRGVSWRAVAGSPASAILETARDLEVHAIAMATRGHATGHRVGSTAAEVFDHASVPLILLGPRALVHGGAARIKIGAQVRTSDRQQVGEVHRVVLDLEQQAMVAIVVLDRGGLARDILVPADFVDRVDDGTLELRVRGDELEQFPDFAYHEFVTPPPTWSEPALVPAREHKRLGPGQVDVTRGTPVRAADGEVGHVDSIELEPEASMLRALWVRANGIVPRAMRIPVEWVSNTDAHGELRLTTTRAEIEGYLGHESDIAP